MWCILALQLRRLVPGCKNFETESFHIYSIKYKLIIKLITELVCKLRDESNETNQSAFSTYLL